MSLCGTGNAFTSLRFGSSNDATGRGVDLAIGHLCVDGRSLTVPHHVSKAVCSLHPFYG